jgi:hypothetical protein
MKWSKPDQNEVDTDLAWLKAFSLLDLKPHVNFVAGFGSLL